jgi:hypothetical protein
LNRCWEFTEDTYFSAIKACTGTEQLDAGKQGIRKIDVRSSHIPVYLSENHISLLPHQKGIFFILL